jgi:hypothetical protein
MLATATSATMPINVTEPATGSQRGKLKFLARDGINIQVL